MRRVFLPKSRTNKLLKWIACEHAMSVAKQPFFPYDNRLGMICPIWEKCTIRSETLFVFGGTGIFGRMCAF
jgi:hypothetical protein